VAAEMKKPYGDLKSIDKSKEVEIPVHPFPYPELRPYQHEVFKQVQAQKAKSGNLFFDTYRLHQLARPTHIGIDLAEPGSKDKSVIAYAKRGRNGKMMIWFDEYADFVMPKWYRHPIQWYKLRRAFHMMKDKVKKAGG
jgi:hypothetical protein